MHKENRRSFIRKSGAAAAAITLGGVPSVSAKSYGRIPGANDRLSVGVIGCMRRANALRPSFADLKAHLRIDYVSDVIRDRREKYAGSIKEVTGHRPKAVNDFREILQDKKVDAVFVLIPDHWHGPASYLALDAGKHVYVEKPLTHNPREGEFFLECEKLYDRVIFMGTQQRSQQSVREVVKEIHAGLIGEVYQVLAHYTNSRKGIGNGKVVPVPDGFDWDLFQGPAPRKPFKDILFDYNWHWFWNWGTGETGNNATHELDVARWVLGVEHPKEVTCNAGKYYFRNDDWTMYDTMDVTFRYPLDKSIRWDGRSRTGFRTYGVDRGNTVYGSEGTVTISRNGYKVFNLDNELTKEVNEATMSVTTGAGGGGDISTNHILNFIETIRGMARPNSVLKEAVKSSHLNHLANISYRAGIPLMCDAMTGKILDDAIMKTYWSREYEPGWEPELTSG